MKKFILPFALLLVLAALVGCGKPSANQLIMVTEATFPPYEFRDAQGGLVGIDIALCQAIADELGRELVVQDAKFDSVIPSVKAGKADLAAAGITVTEDRKQSVDFSIPYVTTGITMITLKGSDIDTPEEVTGKKVGVQAGTTSDTYMVERGQEPDRYESPALAVAALKAGKVDLVICDIDPASIIVSKDSDVQISGGPLSKEDYAIAVNKGNAELLAVANRVIERLKTSGEFAQIVAKYSAMADELKGE